MTGKGQELYATLKTALADYVFTEAYNAGATAFASGDYKTAITQLKKATEAKTDDFNAWYYLAFSYYNLNDTENADKTLAETIVRFPQYEELLSSYITDSSVLTTAKSKSTGNTADTQSNSSDSNQTTSTEAGQTTQDAYTAADQNSVAQDAGNTDTGNGYYDENGIWVQTY